MAVEGEAVVVAPDDGNDDGHQKSRGDDGRPR